MPDMGDSPTSAIGTPDEIRVHLRALQDAGVDQVLLMHQGGRMPFEANCRSLELFAKAVMPEFVDGEDEREAPEGRAARAGDRSRDRRKAYLPPPGEVPEVAAYGHFSHARTLRTPRWNMRRRKRPQVRSVSLPTPARSVSAARSLSTHVCTCVMVMGHTEEESGVTGSDDHPATEPRRDGAPAGRTGPGGRVFELLGMRVVDNGGEWMFALDRSSVGDASNNACYASQVTPEQWALEQALTSAMDDERTGGRRSCARRTSSGPGRSAALVPLRHPLPRA